MYVPVGMYVCVVVLCILLAAGSAVGFPDEDFAQLSSSKETKPDCQ